MKAMISKSRRVVGAAMVLTLATVLCAAQGPKPASKGLVIKGKAPISSTASPIKRARRINSLPDKTRYGVGAPRVTKNCYYGDAARTKFNRPQAPGSVNTYPLRISSKEYGL